MHAKDFGATMPDRDLRLNSLSRYTKTSPEFVLEERAHCEIPAGCGGVVLRWWNPKRGLPLDVRVYPSEAIDLRLDGLRLVSGLPLVEFGDHVFSVVIRAPDPSQASLLFLARYGQGFPHPPPWPQERHFAVLSSPDGTWRYSPAGPADDDAWMQPGFDDSGWAVMESSGPESIPREHYDRHSYWIEKLIRLGAHVVIAKDAGPVVRVRKEFAMREDS